MEADEDGNERGRDWLDGRRGLDRESLERVEAERGPETEVEPGLLARLSRVRRAVSTPLRVAAGGIRWAAARLPRDRGAEEEANPSMPIADGTDSAASGDHYVGTRTGHPEPPSETPDVEDRPESARSDGGDPEPEEAGEERPTADD